MDFVALSLPEAAYLYMGLAVQALVRQSSLRWLPGVIVLVWTLVLLGRAGLRAAGGQYRSLLGYLGASLVILVLFWPEAVPFGRRTDATDPTRVASYAATQDPDAAVITAEDTGAVPATLRDPTLLAPGFRLLLRAITETPLVLARTINSQAHRTFASLLPMQWLLTQELTAEAVGAVGDWVHNCLLPAKTLLMQAGGGQTYQDLLPWDGSPLRGELARRQVTPGAQTGIQWLRASDSGTAVRCDVYLDAVELRVQRWLATQTTERGTPLLDVFQRELGLSPQDQARFLVYREMLRAAGPAVPAPSLTGTYAALRGVSVLGGMLGGAADEGVRANILKSAGFSIGGLSAAGGAAKAALQGAGNEFQRAIDGIAWVVGLAVFLTWWGPYLIGLINLVLIGLFPIVVLWALMPQSQFQPLAHYFAALFFTASMPLWWALVDVAQRLANTTAPQVGSGLVETITHATAGWAWASMITALGILLIPVVVGILIFSVFRAIGGLWRGSL
jgi:hypothetical protein